MIYLLIFKFSDQEKERIHLQTIMLHLQMDSVLLEMKWWPLEPHQGRFSYTPQEREMYKQL